MYKCLKPLNWVKSDKEVPKIVDGFLITNKMVKYFGKVNLYMFSSTTGHFKLSRTSWYFNPKWFLKKYQLDI